MKKNIYLTMKKLDVDPEIRNLIKQMWKHNYKTIHSCEGGVHRGKGGNIAYVTFRDGSGDGWFEKNAHLYGLRNEEEIIKEFLKYYLNNPDSNVLAVHELNKRNGIIVYKALNEAKIRDPPIRSCD